VDQTEPAADADRRLHRQLARWQLTIDGPPFGGGTGAIVLPVRRADASSAVIKLGLLGDAEARHEHAALRAFHGDGAVLLLDHDPETQALLLERLEPGAPLSAHPDRGEAIDVVCELLRRLWRPAPRGHPFPLATDLARRWAHEIPARHQRAGGPFERALVDGAVSACEDLARADSRPPIIGNRDVHLDNVLSARRQPWLLIDPKPVAAERAFDVAYLAQDALPERPSRQNLDGLLDRLSRRLDVSAGRVRKWMLVRQVDNALLGLADGEAWARRDLHIARLLPA
jgi:streptomycin 6-kinase